MCARIPDSRTNHPAQWSPRRWSPERRTSGTGATTAGACSDKAPSTSILPKRCRQIKLNWTYWQQSWMTALGSMRLQHDLDALVLAIAKHLVGVGGLIDRQTVGDHERRIDVAPLDPLEQ